MSRTLSFSLKEMVESLKKEVRKRVNTILSLEADFLQMRALNQKVEYKPLPLPDVLTRQVEFNHCRTFSLPKSEQRPLSWLPQSQENLIEAFKSVGSSLGYQTKVRALPEHCGAVLFEFEKPKEREKVPLGRRRK